MCAEYMQSEQATSSLGYHPSGMTSHRESQEYPGERVRHVKQVSHRRIASYAAYTCITRMMDVVVSALLLLLSLPLFVIVGLMIKAESSGPVFFRQTRIGKNGRPFTIYKFRSMRCDAPIYGIKPKCDRTDSRVTRVGYVLRQTRIDEIPQFFNILKGEMSLVGPRPEMPFLVEQYTPEQRRRLEVTPGLTGYWQVSPARKLPMHENLHYDLYYVDNRSLFLNMVILFKTTTMILCALCRVCWILLLGGGREKS